MSMYLYNIDLYFVYLIINLRHAIRQGALWAYVGFQVPSSEKVGIK